MSENGVGATKIIAIATVIAVTLTVIYDRVSVSVLLASHEARITALEKSNDKILEKLDYLIEKIDTLRKK